MNPWLLGGMAMGGGALAGMYGNQFFRDLSGQSINPQYGTTTALTGMQNGYLDPNSGMNRDMRGQNNQAMDDMERRTRGAMSFVRDQQMGMENFRNQYSAAENQLNRYLQMRQMGLNALQGAYSQRF